MIYRNQYFFTLQLIGSHLQSRTHDWHILGHILTHTRGTYYVLYERKGGPDKYVFLILRLRLFTIVFCEKGSFGSSVCTALIFKGNC